MPPVSRLSPYPLAAPDIREAEQALCRLAGGLERALPPHSAAAIRRAMTGIHSYYSNLIEGYGTEPIAAELAMTSDRPPRRAEDAKHMVFAAAGIQAARAMNRMVSAPGCQPFSADFVCDLHRSLINHLPEECRWIDAGDGERVAVVPGKYRDHHVRVGDHIAPAPDELPGLMDAITDFPLTTGRTVSGVMLAHHRLLWVHPFVDGNGRVARLHTEALLLGSQAAGAGLWSLSRGLAKNLGEYRAALAIADNERRGPNDGRGVLSEAAAGDFVRFMLRVSIDQASFMLERLRFEEMELNLERLCEARSRALGRDDRAFHLLRQCFCNGPVERGQVGALVGLSARRGQGITRECLEDGLLGSPTDKGLLYPDLPMYAMAYVFPSLFPVDRPEAQMRESLGSPLIAASGAVDDLVPPKRLLAGPGPR